MLSCARIFHTLVCECTVAPLAKRLAAIRLHGSNRHSLKTLFPRLSCLFGYVLFRSHRPSRLSILPLSRHDLEDHGRRV
ncbi:unnamed protein product [Peniophora sp. CBMAI 1063]|nr:unnamed protein product [Peniophora sp. CBMAI 1063]